MARVNGRAPVRAHHICRYCSTVVHEYPDGRRTATRRIAGVRRNIAVPPTLRRSFGAASLSSRAGETKTSTKRGSGALKVGARQERTAISSPCATMGTGLAGSPFSFGTRIGNSIIVPRGHPVRISGHPVGRPGHPVNRPGHPIARPSHPVTRSGHPVNRPGHAIERSNHAVQRPAHAVRRPDHGVRRPDHAIRRPGQAVQRPNHAVRRPNHAVARPSYPVQRPGRFILRRQNPSSFRSSPGRRPAGGTGGFSTGRFRVTSSAGRSFSVRRYAAPARR